MCGWKVGKGVGRERLDGWIADRRKKVVILNIKKQSLTTIKRLFCPYQTHPIACMVKQRFYCGTGKNKERVRKTTRIGRVSTYCVLRWRKWGKRSQIYRIETKRRWETSKS